jgi:hypothetical protein
MKCPNCDHDDMLLELSPLSGEYVCVCSFCGARVTPPEPTDQDHQDAESGSSKK